MCPSSDDAEFLWRLARASRDLALLPSMEAERKKQLTFDALDYAQKALEKDETCFAAHKVKCWLPHSHGPDYKATEVRFLTTFIFLPHVTQWYAVCLSDVGDYKGVKVKIGNSYIIREHLEVRGQSHVVRIAGSYLSNI